MISDLRYSADYYLEKISKSATYPKNITLNLYGNFEVTQLLHWQTLVSS